MRRPLFLFVGTATGLTALALAGCRTDEIGANTRDVVATQTDPHQGGLVIALAPPDATLEQAQVDASGPPLGYQVMVDGQELVDDDYQLSTGSVLTPILIGGGAETTVGYLNAGSHSFALKPPGGAAPAFEVDGEIQGGMMNRLFIFGSSDARQGLFASYPFTPADGSEHVVAVNLLHEGSIQVVSCSAASTCTAVSPPLGPGDSFQGDFPAITSDNGLDSLSGSGAGIGYQMIPSAAVPTPPILMASPALGLSDKQGTAGQAVLNFIVAPIYMSPDGQPQEWAD
jgi:hypothetical protein